MPTQFKKPYRSMLYVPADSTKMLGKVDRRCVDAVIFDLEDAVAPANKALARELLHEKLLTIKPSRKSHIVRLNAPKSADFAEDLKSLKGTHFDAVLIPKVESSEHISFAIKALQMVSDKPPAIWAMIETPLGVLNSAEIAASPHVKGLIVGTNDLSALLKLRSGNDRTPLHPFLSQILLAGRAHDCYVIDGVYNALNDTEGFNRHCREGKHIGFDGVTIIHPNQIEVANQAYSPDAQALIEATDIVNAWAAQSESVAVLSVNGRMTERLHLDAAKELLAIQQQIARYS